jgi:predicted Zn-dependent protease
VEVENDKLSTSTTSSRSAPNASLTEVQTPLEKEASTVQLPTQIEPASVEPIPSVLNAEITPNAQPLVLIMQASSKEDWGSVDNQTQAIKQAASPVRGNRKLSREANAEGLEAFRQSNFPAAIAAFERGVRADPNDVELMNNLGYAHLQAEHVKDSIRILTHVLLLAPDRSSAWANLAEVYALKSKNDEAVAALILAFQFSSNKDRTVTFLNERAGDANSPLQATAKKTIEIIQKM